MLKLLQNRDHWYNCEFRMRLCKDILSVMLKTRMHSSRMRTVCSSSRRGVSTRHTPRPQSRPRGPGTPSPAAGPTWDQALPPGAPPGPGTPPDQAPPPRGQTHACKHIKLPQTSFAGGKYSKKTKIDGDHWFFVLLDTLYHIPRSPDSSIDILHKISRELFNVQFVP